MMDVKESREEEINRLFLCATFIIAGNFPSRSLPLRIVAGAWCLIAVVIFYAYTSTLISYISLPVYDPIINNWEELAASKTLRVATYKGSPFSQLLLVRILWYLKIPVTIIHFYIFKECKDGPYESSWRFTEAKSGRSYYGTPRPNGRNFEISLLCLCRGCRLVDFFINCVQLIRQSLFNDVSVGKIGETIVRDCGVS